MMFNKSIQSDMTILNLYEDDKGFLVYKPTVLRGVFWRVTFADKLNTKGLAVKDNLTIIIPKSINAEGKKYIPSSQYLLLDDNAKNDFWTISKEDKLVKGELWDTLDNSDLILMQARYEVFTVEEYKFNDFGNEELKHYVIKGV